MATRLDVGFEAVRASATLLSDAERERASRFAFERDRRRFTVARARLRRLLSARLGVRPESVEFVYGAHGKPALARRFADSDLRFNVSHCADVAVYAFAPGREIGIDVEAIREIRDADDIAARFFSSRENEAYLALDPRLQCMARGELVGAIAMSEPAAGSDLQGIKTTARRDGDNYVINGSKTFTTNGLQAGIICLAVKTDARAAGPNGMSLIIVEAKHLPGYHVGRSLEKVGMHGWTPASFSSMMCVPASNLLGSAEDNGFFQMMEQLPYERLTVGVGAVATAE